MSDAGKIRVLIIDDSATIRSALKIMIRREEDMVVVGTAPNGAEGVRMAIEDSPDVILMDIEMPVMNGIEATRRIMEVNPVPILIFSSLAEESAPLTLEALDSGAVDFVLKDTTSKSAIDIGEIKRVLVEKIRAFCKKRDGDSRPAVARTIVRNRKRMEARTSKQVVSRAEVDSPRSPLSRPSIEPTPRERSNPANTVGINRKHAVKTMRFVAQSVPRNVVRIVGIGASTGGPQALTTLVQSFTPDIRVPIVIAQHMPASFVAPFARRLDNAGPLSVEVAEHEKEIAAGTVVIAPGGAHLRVRRSGGRFYANVSREDVPDMLHKPSVDVLFESIADCVTGLACVAVLTGMGRDGANGAKLLHGLGATVIAQDEASSVVYGMPRAVRDDGSANVVLPIEEIGDAIVSFAGGSPR